MATDVSFGRPHVSAQGRSAYETYLGAPRKGYEYLGMTENGSRYIYSRKKEVEAKSPTWKEVFQLNCPYIVGGVQANRMRFAGYFPGFGFYAGLIDMLSAIDSVYDRVIRGENVINVYEREQGHSRVYETVKEQSLQLGMVHSLYIVARNIGLLMRGIVTFCQLGILFAPIDYVADKYFTKA